MEQQTINQEILDRLNQLEVKINLIMERLPEEEPLMDVEEQLEMGLKDMKEGRIMSLNNLASLSSQGLGDPLGTPDLPNTELKSMP